MRIKDSIQGPYSMSDLRGFAQLGKLADDALGIPLDMFDNEIPTKNSWMGVRDMLLGQEGGESAVSGNVMQHVQFQCGSCLSELLVEIVDLSCGHVCPRCKTIYKITEQKCHSPKVYLVFPTVVNNAVLEEDEVPCGEPTVEMNVKGKLEGINQDADGLHETRYQAHCVRCQARIKRLMTYCHGCGERVNWKNDSCLECQICGVMTDDNFNYCWSCGAEFNRSWYGESRTQKTREFKLSHVCGCGGKYENYMNHCPWCGEYLFLRKDEDDPGECDVAFCLCCNRVTEAEWKHCPHCGYNNHRQGRSLCTPN